MGYWKESISITWTGHRKMLSVNESQKLTEKGSRIVLDSLRAFRREKGREGRMAELHLGLEFGNVSKRLKEDIIKDHIVLKARRMLNQDKRRALTIEGRLLQEHIFKMETLSLQHGEEELLRMSENRLPLHHNLTGQIPKVLCVMRQGLPLICLIDREPQTIRVQVDHGTHLIQDVQIQNRSKFKSCRRD
jgi:hypothetical protein